MAKRIKRDDDMYKESLSWMSYRYAIGITEYAGRSSQSAAERYRMFRDIEFDTEEFHALATAFADFLKRKNIKNIVDLRDRYRENDLIWLSRNYAMGRHSYAASHCEDIMTYSNEVLSPERKESVIPYIDTWVSVHNPEGRILYERAKIPIDRIPSGFHRTYLNEKYIVEDNVTD